MEFIGNIQSQMSLQYRIVKHYTRLVSINSRSLKRRDYSRCHKIIDYKQDVGIPKRWENPSCKQPVNYTFELALKMVQSLDMSFTLSLFKIISD